MSPEISVSADFSAAPEIAQLARPAPLPGQPSSRRDLPLTAGRQAGALAALAAAPERWWDQVRFDPSGPLRISVSGADGAWLLVVPPGAAADCDCGYATLVAGEATEDGRPLRPGRVLLHGASLHGAPRYGAPRYGAPQARALGNRPHRLLGAAHGYCVSLHSLSQTTVAPDPAR